MNFNYASKTLKKYARTQLHMTPTEYETKDAFVLDERGEMVRGQIITLSNSKRRETVTSEELAWFNEYLA